MRKILLFVSFISIHLLVFAQDEKLINVLPPSPNASSVQKYGNTSTNNYSGSVNVSIPIYTIKYKGLTLPIILNYTGSNGIKVQEFATYTGLAWTLNFGGMVSRTIRGLADEETNGYLHTNFTIFNKSLSSVTENDIALRKNETDKIIQGTLDGEPDIFYYNFNGVSGQFYLKKNGDNLVRPLNNIVIKPIFNDGEIDAFEIRNSDGAIYVFSQKEISKTIYVGQDLNKDYNNTSSWYLSEIRNYNNNGKITFDYNTLYNLKTVDEVPTLLLGKMDERLYVTTISNARRISEIHFGGNSVKFNYGELVRKDKKGDVYLENITIRDSGKRIIKQFNFKYSYFAENGVIDMDNNRTVGDYGDYNLRLKLDELQELGKPPYKFNYYTNQFLPEINSFARDHWGYYNGKTDNNSLEPYYIISYQTSFSQTVDVHEFGSADRSSSDDYVRAGILKEIIYPTGGKTEFNYEINEAKLPVSPFFPGRYVPRVVNLEDDKDTGTIVINSLQTYVKVKISAVCDEHLRTVTIRNLSSGNNYTFQLYGNSNGDCNQNETIEKFFPVGNYQASFIYTNGNCCDPGYNPPPVRISWNDEEPIEIQKVGGVRIKTINNIVNHDTITKSYKYENGSLVTIPEYGRLIFFDDPYVQGIQNLVGGWERTINSNRPLLFTKGNVVGYKKITEMRESKGETLGKTEFKYLTAEDHPDYSRGWHWEIGDDLYFINGKYRYTLPYVQSGQNDFSRGILLNQTNYKLDGNQFKKVSQTQFQYNIVLPYLGSPDVHNSIIGFKAESGSGGVQSKYYKIFEAYIKKIQEKNTLYYLSDSIVSNKYYFYKIWEDSLPVLIALNKVSEINSCGDTLVTEYKYTPDYLELTGVSNNERDAVKELFNRNVIISVEEVHTNNKKIVQKQRTNYKTINSLCYPDNFEFALGNNGFEKKIFYDQYDSLGNILQYHKKDDIITSFYWGYDNTYPIAKIEGLAYDSIPDMVKTELDKLDDNLNNSALQQANNTIRENLPQNCFITTYTYKPLIGIKTMTDPNGKTSYYEYDNFGRLVLIKDNKGNIIKNFKYNYKDQ